MTRAHICIVSLAPLERDARVLRQIDCAAREHRVTVVGWGHLDHQRPGVAVHSVDRHVFANGARILQAALLTGGRRWPDLFERWYWRKPDHREALRLVTRDPPRLIHANDAMALPIAVRAARTTGASVLFDAHEYSLDQWKGNAPLRLMAGPLHRYLITAYAPRADAMITVAPGIAARYTQRLGVACGVVLNAPAYTPTPFRPTQAGRVRLVHHGAAIRGRGLERLIHTASLLPDRFTLELMLVPGSKGHFDSLRGLAERIAPGRVTFVEPVPTARVVETIAASDVGVFLLPPGDVSYELALPNKFFDFLMAGLAVSIGPSPEMARIVRQEGCGIVADGFEAADLARSLTSLAPSDIDDMKRSSLRAAKTYNAEAEMDKLADTYRRLLTARDAAEAERGHAATAGVAAVDGRQRPVALVVSPFVWEGGLGTGKPTVWYTLRGLQRAGYDVHVVCPTNRPGVREDTIAGVRVSYVRIPIGSRLPVYDATHSFLSLVRAEPRRWLRHLHFRIWWLQFVALGIWRAWRLSRVLDPVFLYGVNNPSVPVAYVVGRLRRVPVFARIMGSEIGQTAGVDLDQDVPPATVRRSWWATARLWAVRFDELLAFRLPTDARIVTDDGQIGPRTITGWLKVPPDRLWLWRNGIDRDRLLAGPERREARAALGLDADAPVVLWVSQLIDWKRPQALVDAVPAVVAQVPAAQFVIVGDGPDLERLRDRARDLGVSDRVRFEGFVRQDRVVLYYRAADVFTALYRVANVSNTLLEALVCGLAVVTLDNGRTADVVQHERTGILVDPDRLGDVAPALTRVLTDDELRRRLGAAAAAWSDENLPSWDERIDREVKAIEAVCARHQARARAADDDRR